MRSFLYFAIVVSSCVTSNLYGQNWDQFGGPNRFCVRPTNINADQFVLAKGWEQEVGDGLGSAVVHGQTVYATSLAIATKSKADSKNNVEEVWAIDVESGKPRWRYSYSAGWLKAQEAFGRRPRAPQATPAVIGDRLVTIGFTGKIFGFELESGKVVWNHDAIDDFGATPVQFGFSASPVPVVVNDRNFVLILVGGSEKGDRGDRGGLICLNANDGKRVWNVPCGEASYATPVVLQHPQGPQVVFQDRENIYSVAVETGQTLWKYKLPKQGLTNVPTPLVYDETSLIVSGQGIGGTQRIQIAKGKDGWEIKKVWSNRTQFFYCNWMIRDHKLIGCNDKLLVVLDAKSGKTVAKWRGYKNSNVLGEGDKMWVVDGKGKFTRFEVTSDAWVPVSTFQLCNTRTWTPISFSENHLFCRAGKKLICHRIAESNSSPNEVVSAEKRELKPLRFRATYAEEYLPKILAAFETAGPKAAWEAYKKIRETRKKGLGLAERSELVQLAISQGLHDFARQIVSDAERDFGSVKETMSMKQALREGLKKPSGSATKGKDGLIYVEFGIRNPSTRKIDTYVQGPAKREFSYGIPFPPGKTRIEKWPVGTKLFFAVDDEPKNVSLVVSKEIAGRTIDLKVPKVKK